MPASNVRIQTQAAMLRRARDVNETSNGYRTLATTITEPVTVMPQTATSQVVFDLTERKGPGMIPNGIILHPFGVGNDDTTFSLRVMGWKPTLVDVAGVYFQKCWVPVELIEVACTCSTATGAATGYVLNTERFADTIALTGSTANAGVNCDIVSPANNTIGSLYVDLKGATMFEVIFTTGGSATSANALWQTY